MIDRAVVRPQSLQQHQILVEPGNALFVRETVGVLRQDLHAQPSAAQLIERRQLTRCNVRRERADPVLDINAEHDGRMEYV